ncbi:MAG: hypothetical protein OEX07_13825 [Gammaproteobacteria bacterium]|nr:hypothetical protein [Gammaproteobacteria bacterium]
MDKVRLGNTISVNNFVITMIERVNIENSTSCNGVYFSVVFESLGVVIECDGVKWAIDNHGEQISIADFPFDEK